MRTDYLELLRRGQSALNSVSQSGSSSVNSSRKGSIQTNSSDNIAAAEEKNNGSSESTEDTNFNEERKHLGSRYWAGFIKKMFWFII